MLQKSDIKFVNTYVSRGKRLEDYTSLNYDITMRNIVIGEITIGISYKFSTIRVFITLLGKDFAKFNILSQRVKILNEVISVATKLVNEAYESQ